MTVTPSSRKHNPTMHQEDSTECDSSNHGDNSQTTDDIINLLESLKIGPEKPTVKREKDFSTLQPKGPTGPTKDDHEYLKRGPLPTTNIPSHPVSAIPPFTYKSEQFSYDLHFPQNWWSKNSSAGFAPGQNDSCRYWTKAKQENRLPQLMMEQERSRLNRLNHYNQLRKQGWITQPKRTGRKTQGGDVTDGPAGWDDDLSNSDLETDFAPADCHMLNKLSDPFLSIKDQWSPASKEALSPFNKLQLTEVELAPESEQDIMLKDIEDTLIKHSPPHFNISYDDTETVLGNFESVSKLNFSKLSEKLPLLAEESVKDDKNEKASRKRTESEWREESKPSPPKMAATDPMYDKDIDEDNILHSLIIANASPEVIEDVLYCLQHEDDSVLGRIINEQNQLLRTPLFLAVMDCKPVVVQTLLEFGADPSIQGKVLTIMDEYELRSPLHLVAEMGDEGIQLLQILLDCERTKLDISSESDMLTPLHLALKSHRVKFGERNRSCYKTVKLLKEKGADIDTVEEKTSKTPLMLAIETFDIDLIKIFLDAEDSSKQADIHDRLQATTRGGDTPLHIAAGVKMNRTEKKKLLRILVKYGADSNAENNCKELPEEIATRELWRETFKC